MPRDGSGVYSLPTGYLAVTGDPILASQHNPPLEDIKDALTASLARNGTAPMTGDLAMGGQDITNVGGITMVGPINEKQGTDIASAATADIGAATGNYVKITGTTTITSLGSATAGVRRTVTFTGALTLTHNATSLILPGAANITTAAGDTAEFASEGSGNWRCTRYDPASGYAITDAPVGQCRLTKSSTNLLLSPYNGNKLAINGQLYTVPSAGVTLAPPTTDGTVYYIYAYMNSGTMTLEASTTAYATDTTTGVAIKSGDATRTLVGMARTVLSAWVDSDTQRFVRSWFNRQAHRVKNAFTADRGTSSNSFVELNSEIRAEFLIWSGEGARFSIIGRMYSSGSGRPYAAISVDGSAPESPYVIATGDTASTQVTLGMTLYRSDLSEGYHYATLMGKCGSPSTSSYDGANDDFRWRLSGMIGG